MNSRRFWIILPLSPQYFREIPEGPRNLLWTTKLQITNRVLREVSEKNKKREKSCRTFWTVNIRRPAITLVVICSIFTCEALEATWMRCSCGGQTDRQTDFSTLELWTVLSLEAFLCSGRFRLNRYLWSLKVTQPLHLFTTLRCRWVSSLQKLCPLLLIASLSPDHIPFQALIILLRMFLAAKETAGPTLKQVFRYLVSSVFVLSPRVSICVQDLKSKSVLSSFQCPFGYPTPLFPEQEMRGQLPTMPSSVRPSATRGPPTAAVPQPHAINRGRRSGCPSAIALWGWSLTSGCLSLWGPLPVYKCLIQWQWVSTVVAAVNFSITLIFVLSFCKNVQTVIWRIFQFFSNFPWFISIIYFNCYLFRFS